MSAPIGFRHQEALQKNEEYINALRTYFSFLRDIKLKKMGSEVQSIIEEAKNKIKKLYEDAKKKDVEEYQNEYYKNEYCFAKKQKDLIYRWNSSLSK